MPNTFVVEFYPSPWDDLKLDTGDISIAFANINKVLKSTGYTCKAIDTGIRGPDCYFTVQADDPDELFLSLVGHELVENAAWDDIYIHSIGKMYDDGIRVHLPIVKQERRKRR